MSRIDENGITHNSFYETDKELGFEPRTEEELMEYKRLIGMPLSEDYDELISSLKTDFVGRQEFNEYDFIRLFLAKLSRRGIVKINFSKLGYELIEFYRDKKYSELFDMQVKQQIEGDFVDMSSCIQQAILGGILSSHSIMNTDERLILLSKEESEKIINSYDKKIVSKMEDMICEYIDKSIALKFSKLHEECKKNPRIQLTTNGTPFVDVVDPEYVVNNFAEDGFVENYCLTEEDRDEVKKLRLEKKSKRNV